MKKAVVHFEIGCSNIAETADFYKKIFNWNVVQQGNSASIITEQKDTLSGHFNKLGPDDPQKYITIYIETNELETDLKSVEHHGGKVLVSPITLPDGRKFAWFEDIAGNTVGLITPKA
ncbi:VOC family protein [Flavobacteriaceae bacterium M23B6Z8]